MFIKAYLLNQSSVYLGYGNGSLLLKSYEASAFCKKNNVLISKLFMFHGKTSLSFPPHTVFALLKYLSEWVLKTVGRINVEKHLKIQM